MSSRPRFGTIKRIVAILIAIVVVLAAGIVVGQAPAIFGVEEEPEASITFEDQEQNGSSVTIDEVSLSDGGFVVITDGGDEPLAVSDYLDAGTHENVTVERDDDGGNEETELVGQLTATVHQDTDDDEGYTYGETDGEEDRPYLEDGFPVSDTAAVTTTGGDVAGDSFLVKSIDAPATATTNETIEVRAEIENPAEYVQQQTVEFRLDGAVLEEQVLELEGGDSREVTFQIDTKGSAPGNRTLGVYTDADGALTQIDLELHADPGVSVADATDDGATVDATLPAEGFVAVERDGQVIGTSDALEAGEHANVSVEFDQDVDDEDELTAVLYEGDPGDVDAASPVEHEGEPVETTFTVAEAGADDADASGDDSGDDGE